MQDFILHGNTVILNILLLLFTQYVGTYLPILWIEEYRWWMERIGIDNTADIEAEKAQRKEITCLKLPTKLVT